MNDFLLTILIVIVFLIALVILGFMIINLLDDISLLRAKLRERKKL